MIIERDGKFFMRTTSGSVEDKPDGRHFKEETVEKEITELEFLRYKVRLLEAEVSDMGKQPNINISYPVCPRPCPCLTMPQPTQSPWVDGKPLWYVDPNLQPTYTCETNGPITTNQSYGGIL